MNQPRSLSNFYSKGFTLIELLVVSVITGIGVASYNYFSDRQKIEQCAKQLKNNLRRTQSNALSGLKGSSCTDEKLDGWYADLANNQYYGKCGGNSFTDSSGPLVEPITCRLSAPTNVVSFAPVSGETDLSADLTIIVYPPLPAVTPSYTVTLGKGGEIR
jgi:prepilin-type N-terminal cleavage/methylation domain-containing protein